jgi:hypothetical protein
MTDNKIAKRKIANKQTMIYIDTTQKTKKRKKKKLKTKKPHQIYNQKSPQNTEGDTMCFSKVDLFH